MAQIFKSKELMFAIPEKESGEQLACAGGTVHLSTFVCQTHHTTFTCFCTFHTCFGTCTFHTCTYHTWYTETLTPTRTPTLCTLASHPTITQPGCTGTDTPIFPGEQEISEIKDIETLEMLKEKLNITLNDVEGKLREAKEKK